MRFRQVHLDFHTSEHIKGIGERFDKEQFQKALILGNVNSITLFSKCHHGWSYHPTKANQMHPNLNFDLLGAQIEAAHEIGVKTPVYFSAGHDEKVATKHPEWQTIDPREHENNDTKFPYYGFHLLCLNTPYLEELLAQIKEVLENYDADGVFLDILNDDPCFCATCQKIMRNRGWEINLENAVKLGKERYNTYAKRVRETVDSVKPGLPVFHNFGNIKRGRMDIVHSNTHLELESLPTGGWGYDHFPISASYARTLGMDFLGMTGKFHKTWGEFGGFKHPNALRYEAALSLANGARISIGDQLHPNGEMDLATYELIGTAFREVEAKEKWICGAENIADIAVLDADALRSYYDEYGDNEVKISDAAAGCSRVLLEGNYLFNFIDTNEAFEKYKILILPECARVDDLLKAKIDDFISKGGKVLACGKGGLLKDDDSLAFDFGCTFLGENEFNPDYIKPEFEIDCLKNSSYVMYSKGYNIEMTEGEVLAKGANSYFNRGKTVFCSHHHTPVNQEDTRPGISLGKDGIYVGWNIFEDYFINGTIYVKKILHHLLDMLLAEKSAYSNLPAQGVFALAKQDKSKIVHLLYASPVRRGESYDVIEDIIPLHNITVGVKNEKSPSRVYIAPGMEEIPFEYSDGYVKLTVPEFENHCMVVIE